MTGSMLELTAPRRAAIVALAVGGLARRGVDVAAGSLEVVEAEVLVPGRPAVLDVVARSGGRLAHLVVGLHRPGSALRTLRGAEEGVLGTFVDDHGEAIAVDALRDAELAPLLVAAIVGREGDTVALSRDDDAALVLAADEQVALSVFPWLTERPHPGVEMLVALDEVGFNHLAAPLALWRRHGRDLGVAQELLAEAVDGWALARVSLRDLFGSRVGPEQAGGDFADEARSLGVMVARLHLAQDKAFGRHAAPVGAWVGEAEASIARLAPQLLEDGQPEEIRRVLGGVRSAAPVIRTHGDLHLGRTARTNHGWVVADWLPGGADAAGVPHFRSPLADVADMTWSLGHVAAAALFERDPTLRPAVEEAAAAWERRNRTALLDGYFSAPGIEELVPLSRDESEALVSLFERDRAARWAQLATG